MRCRCEKKFVAKLFVAKLAGPLAIALGKGVGNCCSERQRDLTKFAVDAGASPE
jgi:hypothetical protein